MKDSQIVQGILAQDNRAFTHLYQKYGPIFTAYVMKNSGSLEDGKELLQVTILKIWNSIKEGKYEDQGKLGQFIYRVADNTWKQELKRRKKTATQELGKVEMLLKDDSEEELQWKLAKDADMEGMFQGIEQLDDTCKELIKLFHLKKVSLLEIAEAKNYPYNNLKKRIFNCRKKLKRMLGIGS